MKLKKSFTLLEVLIAAGILAVGMIAAMGLFTHSFSNYRTSRALYEAGMLAKNKLNEIKTTKNFNTTSGEKDNIIWSSEFDKILINGTELIRLNLNIRHKSIGAFSENFTAYFEG